MEKNEKVQALLNELCPNVFVNESEYWGDSFLCEEEEIEGINQWGLDEYNELEDDEEYPKSEFVSFDPTPLRWFLRPEHWSAYEYWESALKKYLSREAAERILDLYFEIELN